MRKLLSLLSIVFVSIIILVGCKANTNYDIVVTNFIGYDAARAVIKDTNLNVKMLLKPGSDIHSYEPSATDIRSVLNCKVFVYVGGESDSEWVESDILGNVGDNVKIVNMFKVLEDSLLLEEDEDEYDEHIWMDPLNYIKVIDNLRKNLSEIYSDYKDVFNKNANLYINKIKSLDIRMSEVISDGNNNMLIIADRNPFAYFSNRYNIEVIGALKGCSSDKNVPLNKIIELKNLVENNKLKVIFKIEMSDGNIADSVKDEIEKDIDNSNYNGNNVVIETLYSIQKISNELFLDNITYVDMFNHNIEVIEYAIS